MATKKLALPLAVLSIAAASIGAMAAATGAGSDGVFDAQGALILPAVAGECLKASSASWQKLLNAATVAWEATARSGGLQLSDESRLLEVWLEDKNCVKHASKAPVMGACFARWNEIYGDALDRPIDTQREPEKIVDQEVDIPSELREAWPEPQKVIATCKKMGWPYVIYDSPVVGRSGLFTTTSRIQIRIRDPRGKFVKLLAANFGRVRDVHTAMASYGFPDPQAARDSPPLMDYLVGSIYVQLKDDRGRALKAPIVTASDVEMQPDHQRWVVQHNSATCYDCHLARLKKTEIKPGSLDPQTAESWKQLADFNEETWQLNQLIGGWKADTQARARSHTAPVPHWGRKESCVACHDSMNVRNAEAHSEGNVIYKKLVDELRMPPPDATTRDLLDRRDRNEPLSVEDVRKLLVMTRQHQDIYERIANQMIQDARDAMKSAPCGYGSVDAAQGSGAGAPGSAPAERLPGP